MCTARSFCHDNRSNIRLDHLIGRRGQSIGHTTAQPIHFTLANIFKVKFMQFDGRKGRDTYLCGRNVIFQFLDDDEWIYFLLVDLHKPGDSYS